MREPKYHPYDEGHYAYNNDIGLEDCPYSRAHWGYQEWRNAWKDADKAPDNDRDYVYDLGD